MPILTQRQSQRISAVVRKSEQTPIKVLGRKRSGGGLIPSDTSLVPVALNTSLSESDPIAYWHEGLGEVDVVVLERSGESWVTTETTDTLQDVGYAGVWFHPGYLTSLKPLWCVRKYNRLYAVSPSPAYWGRATAMADIGENSAGTVSLTPIGPEVTAWNQSGSAVSLGSAVMVRWDYSSHEFHFSTPNCFAYSF